MTLGVTHLSFNSDEKKVGCIYLGDSMSRSSISDLRAAIYQTEDSNEQLKEIKSQMIVILAHVEEKLLKRFLSTTYGYQKITTGGS